MILDSCILCTRSYPGMSVKISCGFIALMKRYNYSMQRLSCACRKLALACRPGHLWRAAKTKVSNGLTWFFQDICRTISSMYMWNFNSLSDPEQKLLHECSRMRFQKNACFFFFFLCRWFRKTHATVPKTAKNSLTLRPSKVQKTMSYQDETFWQYTLGSLVDMYKVWKKSSTHSKVIVFYSMHAICMQGCMRFSNHPKKLSVFVQFDNLTWSNSSVKQAEARAWLNSRRNA